MSLRGCLNQEEKERRQLPGGDILNCRSGLGGDARGGNGSGRHGDGAVTILAETAYRLPVFEGGWRRCFLSPMRCWA